MFHSISKNLMITVHNSLSPFIFIILDFINFCLTVTYFLSLDPTSGSISPKWFFPFLWSSLLLYMWQTGNNLWLQARYFYKSVSSIHFKHCSIIINVHYNTVYNYYITTHNTGVFIIERFFSFFVSFSSSFTV